MGTFQIRAEREPDVLLLRPEGYINDHAGAQLREECEAAIAENLRNIIINFESSDHINSVGISNLIAVIEHVQEAHGHLVFTGLSTTVREVFEIMGITRHVVICDDPVAARSKIASSEG